MKCPTGRRIPRAIGVAALIVGIAGSASGCSVEPPKVSGSAVVRSSASADPGRPMARSAPRRVQIPALGVDSKVMALGLADDGTMEVPPAAFPAGWFTGAPTPGELGPAIIVGHVDWRGRRGVFVDLHKVKRGDGITVVRTDGSSAMFLVDRVQVFDKDAFPTATVYGNTEHAALRLITCGGSFDRRKHRYRDNVVVFAQLSRAVPAKS
jgi:sortase (surface protein transpeptidase)